MEAGLILLGVSLNVVTRTLDAATSRKNLKKRIPTLSPILSLDSFGGFF